MDRIGTHGMFSTPKDFSKIEAMINSLPKEHRLMGYTIAYSTWNHLANIVNTENGYNEILGYSLCPRCADHVQMADIEVRTDAENGTEYRFVCSQCASSTNWHTTLPAAREEFDAWKDC